MLRILSRISDSKLLSISRTDFLLLLGTHQQLTWLDVLKPGDLFVEVVDATRIYASH